MGRTVKERLKEVKKKEVIGHWELDTVVFSYGKEFAGYLVLENILNCIL